MRTIGHLLGFELKRIKWLIVAAWVFMAMAFTPRLLGIFGWWGVEWHKWEDFLVSSGITGFGLAGFFLAVWSGVLGKRLFPARPVSYWKIALVGWGVLIVVLVLPVLGLTALTMWLYGFSSEVVVANLSAMLLGIVPLWAAVRAFAKFGGSLRTTMVGLVIVGGFIFLGEAFGYRELYQPWGELFWDLDGRDEMGGSSHDSGDLDSGWVYRKSVVDCFANVICRDLGFAGLGRLPVG